MLLKNYLMLFDILVYVKNLTLSDSIVEANCKKLAKLAKSFKFLQMLLDELKLEDLP